MEIEIMAKSSLDEIPECIHDGRRRANITDTPEKSETQCYCQKCDALLFTKEFDRITMETVRRYHDEVYELLYTRKGRRKLFEEYLELKGWEIPDHG